MLLAFSARPHVPPVMEPEVSVGQRYPLPSRTRRGVKTQDQERGEELQDQERGEDTETGEGGEESAAGGEGV